MPGQRRDTETAASNRARPARAGASPKAKPGAATARPASPPRGERIAKLLARAGVGSRRDIERMIAEGRVTLNGAAVTTPATLLASVDGLAVDGQPVLAAEPARLFLFHKPPGFLTAARDPSGRPTIHDILPAGLPRLMPVGRLDLMTEGLLLLTNDGSLKRRLELPANGVPRTYRVRAIGDVRQADLEQLAMGVTIAGVRYGPVDAEVDRRASQGSANVWLTMRLTEGKNREVRRLCEAMGLKVSRLIRTAFGPFTLEDLPPRAVVEVPAADVQRLLRRIREG
ncbi:MAG: pseudouridine synthase [Sphingomonadaceae bacterium]